MITPFFFFYLLGMGLWHRLEEDMGLTWMMMWWAYLEIYLEKQVLKYLDCWINPQLAEARKGSEDLNFQCLGPVHSKVTEEGVQLEIKDINEVSERIEKSPVTEKDNIPPCYASPSNVEVI